MSIQVSPREDEGKGESLSLAHSSSLALDENTDVKELSRRVRSLEQLLSAFAAGQAVDKAHDPEPPSVFAAKHLS